MPNNPNTADDSAEENAEKVDNSLRGSSMRRAVQQEIPTTLTPYEWEQWYLEHGVPEAHRKVDSPPARRWWQLSKWFKRTL